MAIRNALIPMQLAREAMRKRQTEFTPEQDDLAIACLCGEVDAKAVSEVMHFSEQNTAYFIKCCLTDAIKQKRIVITKVTRGK